jgi:hypothetical protein
MTVRGVISEAWRNISTGTTWAILWAVAVSVFLSLLLLSDIATIRRIEHDVHTFQAAEANVRKMVTDGQVDGSACSELTRVSTVQASGAIREAEPL